jgi:hypothetical protein
VRLQARQDLPLGPQAHAACSMRCGCGCIGTIRFVRVGRDASDPHSIGVRALNIVPP